MTETDILKPEWQRIDVLGECVSRCRLGAPIDDTLSHELDALNQAVQKLRRRSPWKDVSEKHGLVPLDKDILACTLAPEAEPRIGWCFQELQPGVDSPFPTPALLRELLFMNERQSADIYRRLSETAPLVRDRLIEPTGEHTYAPLRPSGLAQMALLKLPSLPSSLPGALHVPADVDFETLVLPEKPKRVIREFLMWIAHKPFIVEHWGACIEGGPVALFCGPSGTGKTFAAKAIANEIEHPLFKVDLGGLVSKYIGETEKNLNRLFNAAEGRRLVLLFDEADALFGKRGEIRDARDRYANMEVSHLLARIEQHDGPVILTSNLRRHIDPAFTRRFQSVIEFPLPDAVLRGQLWRLHFPPGAPLSEELDFDLLARASALTGGQIRNAALHAAFLAADAATPIAPCHVASAVWTELAKEGREMLPSSIGELKDHLPKEVDK